MSNESNASAENKMGELYVDFGAKGLGGLLSGLNGVKAQFLLTKTAAEQAIKPVVGMSKSAAGSVTEFNKINAVTGLTISQLQDLKVWSELNNVSFGELTNQLKSMQQNLLDIRLGRGDVSGYQLLGIDPSQLDYRNPMQAFAKIRERVQQVDEATGALALRQLGFSEDLLYAFKQNNNEIDKRLFLNNKEIQSLNEQQRAWNRLGATWNQAQQKFIANQKWIVDLLDKTTGVLNTLNVLISGTPEQKYDVVTKGVTDLGKSFGSGVASWFSHPLPVKLGNELGKEIAGYAQYLFSDKANRHTDSRKFSDKVNSHTDSMKTIEPFPYLPPLTESGYSPTTYNSLNRSVNSNNNININQYITGNNAQDIAQNSREMMVEQLNNMELINEQGT